MKQRKEGIIREGKMNELDAGVIDQVYGDGYTCQDLGKGDLDAGGSVTARSRGKGG